MKKLFMFFAILFIVSGCDNEDVKTLTCNSTNSQNGITTETTYDFEYEDDEVKYITMTYHYRDANADDVDGINADTDGLDEENGTDDNNDNGVMGADDNDDDNDNIDNDNNNTGNARTGDTTTDTGVARNGNTDNGTTGTGDTDTNNIDNGNNATDNNDTSVRNGNNNTNATTNNNAGLSSDDIVDGIVGDTIDEVINTVTDTIYDIAGLRTALERQYAIYDNIEGFSYDVDTDSDTEYRVVYKIDMDVISDDDLARFYLDRNLDTVRNNYEGLGYTCQ